MADITVTVEMPAILENPEILQRALRDAAVTALDAEMPSQAAEVVQSPDFPRDRGLMQRALISLDPEVRGDAVHSGLRFAGQASYGVVQEEGRKAGSRNPPYAAILGWVKRRRADAVNDLAAQLQSSYNAAHPKRRKGVSRAIKKFRERAAHLLARGLIAKLRERGMPGKHFVRARIPAIEKGVAEVYAREIREALRRLGAGE